MEAAPEPLRKIETSYRKITPFGDTGPKREFTNVSYKEGEMAGPDIVETHFKNCTFLKVTFTDIRQCLFDHCQFDLCDWEGGLKDCQFNDSRLVSSNFENVKINNVRLSDCEVLRATFHGETHFANVELGSVRGLETAWGLENVHVIPGFDHAWQAELDRQISALRLPRITKLTSWTRLRKYGRLPFFATSYTGLVSIPAALFLISIFNEQVAHLKALAGEIGGEIAVLAGRLHPIPIPSLSLLALASLFLLAIASTIYAVACPARIKEFSYERWVDEFRRPAIQYLPLGWRSPFWRVICWICYPLGAAGVAVVLAVKLVTAMLYIVRHSPMPWGLK